MAENRQQPPQPRPDIRNDLDPRVAPKVKPGQSDKKAHAVSPGTGASTVTTEGGGGR
jgi:hypothetical protein